MPNDLVLFTEVFDLGVHGMAVHARPSSLLKLTRRSMKNSRCPSIVLGTGQFIALRAICLKALAAGLRGKACTTVFCFCTAFFRLSS